MIWANNSKAITIVATISFVTLCFVKWYNSRHTVRSDTIQDASLSKISKPPLKDGVSVRIFYGSQTGTSETFARELAEEAIIDLGVDCGEAGAESVEVLNDPSLYFSKRPLCVVLILSTYGEGDASDDALRFDEWLRALEGEMFVGVEYCVFGLGNKQYAFYNEMAKRTDKKIHLLGGKRICSIGFGDDNADIEQNWEDWKEKEFWPKFSRKYFGKEYLEVKSSAACLVRNPVDKVMLNVRFALKRSQLPFDATVTMGGSDLVSKFFFAANIVPIVSKTDLCVGKVQIDLDITKVPSLKYRTGDTLDVLPLNRNSDVEYILSGYGLDRDTLITFTRKKSVKKISVKKPFPTPCTVGSCIERFLDLSGHPSRVFIRDICVCMANQNSEEIISEIKQGRFTVCDFLRKYFPNFFKKIDFETFIGLIPKQKSRAYSICSSALVNPKTISLLVSKVDEGALCSKFLVDEVASTKDGGTCTLHVNLRCGVFRFPIQAQQGIVMVCVGTGFAPFRAFLAEIALKGKSNLCTLIFGCRTHNEWIYKQEMLEFEQAGGELFVAFSREEFTHELGDSTQKTPLGTYVQDLVEIHAKSISERVCKQRAITYVCGSTGMGLAVLKVVDKHIGNVEELRIEKRYIEELWG